MLNAECRKKALYAECCYAENRGNPSNMITVLYCLYQTTFKFILIVIFKLKRFTEY
jgi:hypothetical protein